MLQQKMLAKAIMIASAAHVEMFDQCKCAYILHPLRVMNGLLVKDPELMQIAVLHDVVEDCPEWSIDKLRATGFSERVLTALSYMTKSPEDQAAGDEGYYSYIRKMFGCLDAMLVKLSDLTDNSQLIRMKGLREKDIDRNAKYMRAYAMIRDEIRSHYPDVSLGGM